MTAGGPLTNEEGAALLAGLDRPIAIAVSGGVDSMALLHLIARWRSSGGAAHLPEPLVLTVDHGLRADSAAEADFVASATQAYGFAHETLAWTGAKPTSGIQEAARQARYDLLLDRLAADRQPRDLLLAHHLEDQAETLLMRLARGSGIDGLGGMRPLEHRTVVLTGAPVREVAIRLRRPLLDVAKSRLVATIAASEGAWRDDPSNADVRFERVRLRRSRNLLADLGLTPESLARSARRLRMERASLLARARALALATVRDHGGAYGEFTLPQGGRCLPGDAVRILARLLEVYGGTAPPAQLSQIETLAERVLQPGAAAAGRLTLGGCLIDIVGAQPAQRTVLVFRETGRSPLPVVTLQPGEGCFWDRRFYIALAREAETALRVAPLPPGSDGALLPGVPRPALPGLPAVAGTGAPVPLLGFVSPVVSCRWPPQHGAALVFGDGEGDGEETI